MSEGMESTVDESRMREHRCQRSQDVADEDASNGVGLETSPIGSMKYQAVGMRFKVEQHRENPRGSAVIDSAPTSSSAGCLRCATRSMSFIGEADHPRLDVNIAPAE